MIHPIVKAFLRGNMDAGGAISALEKEVEWLQAGEAAAQLRGARAALLGAEKECRKMADEGLDTFRPDHLATARYLRALAADKKRLTTLLKGN